MFTFNNGSTAFLINYNIDLLIVVLYFKIYLKEEVQNDIFLGLDDKYFQNKIANLKKKHKITLVFQLFHLNSVQ